MRFFKSDNTAAVSRGDSCRPSPTPIPAPRSPMARIAGRSGSIACSANSSAPRCACSRSSSGTAANSLALATFCPPWGTVLTHAEAHIERDECGAPEFFTGGAKLSLVGGAGAKIRAADLPRAARLVRAACARRAAAHVVHHAGHRTRRDLHAAGNRRAGRRLLMSATWPCTWTARASPMRWWPRKCSPAELTWKAGSTCCRLASSRMAA